LLRRAFSIAELRHVDDGVEVSVLFRLAGAGTKWLSSLQPGNELSVLGPLGGAFPIHQDRPLAFMIAGGVGLPPLLWLGEHLGRANRKTIAFVGAQTKPMFALSLRAGAEPDPAAHESRFISNEFGTTGIPEVYATDDGSFGFRGFVTEALSAYLNHNRVNADEVVVYACGPEPMLRATAALCAERNLTCHVCMERAMACGLGTCQSCVVPVADREDSDGWRFALCCTEGPVFDAATVRWT
jgi:dihydroorotate dehydrogenase electron transfer subunit